MTFVAGIIFGIVLCAISHTCKPRRFVRLAHGLNIAVDSIESVGLSGDSKNITVRAVSGCCYYLPTGDGCKSYDDIMADFEKAARE